MARHQPAPQLRQYAKLGDQEFLPHHQHPDLFAVPGDLLVTRDALERRAAREGLPLTFHPYFG